MSHLCLLGVATLTLTSASFAGSDTNADLQTRLEAAEARISELSAATNVNWLNDARADEIRGLVHDVLADADTRASLQGAGSTAGYNGGFTVGSADGNWSMTTNGLFQTRWTNSDESGDDQWGFSNNRSWLHFSGTIAGDYGFDVRHNLDSDGEEWANGSLSLSDGWGLTMGTFKMATSREALIGQQNQMGLDNGVYTTGQGISVSNSGDDMGMTFQLVNNDGTDEGHENDSSYTWNVRVEMLVDGTWGQFDQFRSAAGGAAGTLVGLSYMGHDEGDGTGGTSEDSNTWNLDAQMQFGGSAFYVSYNDEDDGTTSTNSTTAMYSMDLDNGWELYVRWVDSDDDGESTAIGLNNYLAGQNAKWTTELHQDDDSDVDTLATQLQFYF